MKVASVDLELPSPPADAKAMLARAQGILIDWDGCLVLGNRFRPSALQFLTCWHDSIVIVSNNSTHLPCHIAQMLRLAGVHFPENRILLAGYETILHAARGRPCRAMILGDQRLRAVARDIGLTLVRDDPEMIILLRDTRFTYRRLERAANALMRGARLLVANADFSHPGPGGRVVPETGALLAAITATTRGLAAGHELMGKPGPMLFRRACAILNIDPGQAVMIGDNPDTDIAGAAGVGMPGILIGLGTGSGLDTLLGDKWIGGAAFPAHLPSLRFKSV